MISAIKELDYAIQLFRKYPKNYEDLEYLAHFLGQFEDIGTYLQQYSMQHRFKIIENFQLNSFASKEVIFKKGDRSSHYYFILDGKIEAFNEERDGTTKLIGIIGVGKQLGDIGILRNQPRSLTCIGKTNGLYLVLTAELFMSLLASNMFTALEKKIKFIETYFPNLKKLTKVQKQRIAYAMGSMTASKGQSISKIGESVNNLFFISEGEMAVDLKSDITSKKMILKIAPGNLIGEECIFFNSSLRYNVRVFSEYSELYTLQKQDVFVLLPSENIDK